MAKVPVINLRKGHAVNYNNDVCVVVSMEHKCPPRMASYVQMSIRSISTKKVYNLRLTSMNPWKASTSPVRNMSSATLTAWATTS